MVDLSPSTSVTTQVIVDVELTIALGPGIMTAVMVVVGAVGVVSVAFPPVMVHAYVYEPDPPNVAHVACDDWTDVPSTGVVDVMVDVIGV